MLKANKIFFYASLLVLIVISYGCSMLQPTQDQQVANTTTAGDGSTVSTVNHYTQNQQLMTVDDLIIFAFMMGFGVCQIIDLAAIKYPWVRFTKWLMYGLFVGMMFWRWVF